METTNPPEEREMLPYDANHAMANEKLNRYRAEAEKHRLAKSAKSDEPSGIERLFVAIGQGLLSIGETFKRSENRPSLPAV
jgi:hypothetical protein